MNAPANSGRRLLGDLLDASHVLSMEQLPGTVAEHAAGAGLYGTLIYLVDVQEKVVRLLTGRGADALRDPDDAPFELRIDGTLPGRAFRSMRALPVAGTATHPHRWWVPLLDGTERIGLLRVDTDTADEPMRDRVRQLASLVALLVVSKRAHSDTWARLVRMDAMSVAAEMAWNLMPPRTFVNDQVTIGASMEPAYEIGGDAFDYALTGDTVHLAVFDAMGHDTAAGLSASLAMATSRNFRRQGAGLVEIGAAIERTLVDQLTQLVQFEQLRYVTAILAELDTRTGRFSWVNHAHQPPVILRGGRWIKDLECPPAHPMGSELGLPATVCHEQLQPGDRIVFYTDGITEARNPEGQEFGLTRFTEFIIRHHAAGLPVPETLRRLIHNVLEYHHGRLQDDATVLLLQWHGPAGETDQAIHLDGS